MERDSEEDKLRFDQMYPSAQEMCQEEIEQSGKTEQQEVLMAPDFFVVQVMEEVDESTESVTAAVRDLGLAAPDLCSGTKKRKGSAPKRRAPKSWQGREGAHPCFLCQKDYKYLGHLRRHMSVEHRLCWPVNQLRCQFCGAWFSSDEAFDEHKVATDKEIKKYFENYNMSEAKQRELVDLWKKYTVGGTELPPGVGFEWKDIAFNEETAKSVVVSIE